VGLSGHSVSFLVPRFPSKSGLIRKHIVKHIEMLQSPQTYRETNRSGIHKHIVKHIVGLAGPMFHFGCPAPVKVRTYTQTYSIVKHIVSFISLFFFACDVRLLASSRGQTRAPLHSNVSIALIGVLLHRLGIFPIRLSKTDLRHLSTPSQARIHRHILMPLLVVTKQAKQQRNTYIQARTLHRGDRI
jgi:hypothetical protein